MFNIYLFLYTLQQLNFISCFLQLKMMILHMNDYSLGHVMLSIVLILD